MAKVKRGSLITSPTLFTIYAQPKIGKTHTCLGLDENAVLFDCHSGADKYVGHIKKITTISDLVKYAEENKNAKPEDKYKIVIIDTAFDIYKMLAQRVLIKFRNALTGNSKKENENAEWYKNPEKVSQEDAQNILNTVDFNRAAEVWEEAFNNLITYLKTCFEKIIMIAHSKSGSALIDKNEIVMKEIELPKKAADSLMRNSDQIGLAFRKGNRLYFDFTQYGEGSKVKLGGRFNYMTDRKVLISEKEGETLNTFWYRIYPDLFGKTDADILEEYRKEEEAIKKAAEAVADSA